MASKESLLRKISQKPIPRNFTMRELDTLMNMCGCAKHFGGRGSSVIYHHPCGETVQFDMPHPGKELYPYQIKLVVSFLKRIGEL